MELFIDFLVGNYMWFLVITIILVFSLIGYIVDSKEQKESMSLVGAVGMEQNLQALAASAQNKSILDAVNASNRNINFQNNTITEVQPTVNVQNYQNPSGMNTNQMNMNGQVNNQINNLQNNINNQMPKPNSHMVQNGNNNSSFEVLGK